MQSFLGFIHGIDYVISHFLVGSIFFYFLILPAGGKVALDIGQSFRKNISILLGLSFLSSFAWMILSVHDMTETWQLENLWVGISDTSFAHIWCLKLIVLFITFLAVTFFWTSNKIIYVLVLFIISSPLAYVLTSHAAAQENNFFVRIALDWVHSFSAGIWTGGLWSLFLWLGQRIQFQQKIDSKISFKVVTRFSRVAMASTAVIAGSGFITAWLNGVPILKPWQSDYGILVLAKLAFFCLALGAAGINQFLHLRKWSEKNETKFVLNLRREVGLEIILIFIVFILVGFLTRTNLPNG